MAASYLREKCVDFIWHSRGTGPNEVWDGEWVRVRVNGYMLQKQQTSTSNSWETRRRNLCYWSCRLQKTTLKITKENKDVCQGPPRTSKIYKSRDLAIQQHDKMQNSNVIMNWGESEPIAVLRSSDSRGRHPRRAPPWIGHAIRHVCEWTHWKRTAGLCRGARFISSNKKRPQQGATLSPWWAGPGVQLACGMCGRVGGWVVCVLGCARDWVGVCKSE